MDQQGDRPILMRRRVTSVGLIIAALVLLAANVARGQSASVARTIDAEVRVAMFELSSGADIAALSRLERLATFIGQDSAVATAPERAALHFMLAESYFRLGMLSAFRREAEASLAAGQSRYASVLRPQLVVEAYRSGDYQRAATLARDLPPTDATGLGPLVAGLAAYQSGDMAAARSSFQRAASANSALSSYAKYMDAVAQLRADTTQSAGAVSTLEAVATSSTGAFADQARLTAAQVAYEGERYADAIRIASGISDSSQVAAPALLTRAWALYKLDRVDEAERAFSDFAARYANRPERDEAQLMAAQAQLELGRAGDAERIFQRVADSTAVQVSSLQSQTNAAIADVSRALVADRAAEFLTVSDPGGAKTLVVSAAPAADLTTVLGSEPRSSTGGTATAPTLSAASAGTRLDSLARSSPAASRVLFAPPSATTNPSQVLARSQTLTAADAAVAVARHRLGEAIEAQQREVELLGRLAASLASDSSAILGIAANYRALTDSLARLDQLMATAEAKLRDMIGREVEATRALAAENSRTADSLRTALAESASPEERAALDAEVATAASYAKIAELTASGLDRAITHHPAFVLRDSIRAHSAAGQATLVALQSSYSGSRRDLDASLNALRNGDGPAARAARQALTEAEGRRTVAESEAIAAVSAELSARASELVASLQKNTEAAQFGIASAAFFRAIDTQRAVGDAGRGGGTPTPPRSAARPERR
jgi:outer membrane protein assembly factor BamD (BamD/ComL family)